MEQFSRPRHGKFLAVIGRKDERFPVDATVKIKQVNCGYVNARISNISVSGFNLQCHSRLLNYETVFLIILALQPLPARIVWSEGSTYGCRFAKPLHRSVLEHMTEMLKHAF